MPAICTATVSPNNCGHRTHTVTWGGVTYTIQRHAEALTSAERQTFLDLAARVLEFDKSTAASAFLHRCLFGDEATNVKAYTFFGPGGALTLTNMRGVAANTWQNLLLGLNGERSLVDFTGGTKFRAFSNGLFPGAGPHGIRLVRSGDNAILYQNANIPANGNERELDTDWLDLPAGFTGEHTIFVQVTSGTQSDDPVYRRVGLLVA